MKEKITRFNLEDAFKALDDIEYSKTDVVESKSLHERFVRNDKTEVLMEEYYNISSTQDLEEARDDREDEIAKAKLAKIEKIVDLDAESPEDIQPSYIGKTIIQCPQCMTLFYKDPADVVASEDDPETVNVGEVCQHCGNKEGYSIIGKVGEVTPEEAEQFEDDVPAEEEAPAEELPSSEEVPEEEPSEEAAEESSAEEDELPNLEEPSDEEELTESKNILEEQVKNALTEEVEEEPAEEPAEEDAELEAEEPAEEVTFDQNEVKDVAAEVAEKVAPKEDAEVVADAVDEVVDAAVEAKLEAEEPAEEPVEEVGEGEEVEELNEDVKADELNKKLKEHNEYIATLQDEIKKEEEAVNNAKNEFIKKLHENNLESLKAALDKAIPEEVKAEETTTDLPTPEEVQDEEEQKEPAELTEGFMDKVKGLFKKKDNKDAATKEAPKAEEPVENKDKEAKEEAPKTYDISHIAFDFEGKDGKHDYGCKIVDSVAVGKFKIDLTLAVDKDALSKGRLAGTFTWTADKNLGTVGVYAGDVESLLEHKSIFYRALANAVDRAMSNDHIRVSDLEVASGHIFFGEKDGLSFTMNLPIHTDSSSTDKANNAVDKKLEEVKKALSHYFWDVKMSRITDTQSLSGKATIPEADSAINSIVSAPNKFEDKVGKIISELSGEVEKMTSGLKESAASKINSALSKWLDESADLRESEDVTDAEIKELFGSEEFSEPISDEEIDKIIADEKLTECNKNVFEEVEDFDEESLNKCVSEALTEVYSNVENFKMTECSLTDDSLVVEGKINFKSGKQRDTSFVFTEGKDAKIICGINEDLDKNGSFNISYSIDNKKMFTENLTYSYHINENLVEGIANR